MARLKRTQLAGMNAHYVYYPLEYFLDAQRDAGFKSAELLGAAPHFLMDYSGYQDPAPVKKMAEERGLEIVAFAPEYAAYHYLLCASDPGSMRRSMDYFKHGLRAAAELGAKYMPIGCRGGDWDEAPQKTYSRAAENLKELGAAAAEQGVILAVETSAPEESRIVNSLPELARLLKDVNHPSVKAALDLCAMGVAGETPRQWFEALGGEIAHVHFTDGRPYGRLIWGDGLYPLDRYLEALNEFGYEGCLGQKITDGRYLDRPAEADKANFAAFEPYFID